MELRIRPGGIRRAALEGTPAAKGLPDRVSAVKAGAKAQCAVSRLVGAERRPEAWVGWHDPVDRRAQLKRLRDRDERVQPSPPARKALKISAVQRLPLGLGTQLEPQSGEIFREDGSSVRAAAHVTLVLQWLGRARGRLVTIEAFGEQHGRNLVQCVNSARQLLPQNAIENMDGGYRLRLPAEVLDGDVRRVGPFTVWPEQHAVLVAPRGMSEIPAFLTEREYLIFDSLLERRGRPVRKAAIEAASQSTASRVRYSYGGLRYKLGSEMFIETPGCYQLK